MLQCFDLRLFFFIVFSIYFLRFVFFIKMHQKKNIAYFDHVGFSFQIDTFYGFVYHKRSVESVRKKKKFIKIMNNKEKIEKNRI